MVDIHSHILPGLDDGSPSMDVSVLMLRAAAVGGTTDIVATPHASPQYPFDPVRVAGLIRDLAAIERTPRIHSGCDFHLMYDNILDAVAHPDKYSINGKGYLLVEFSDLVVFQSTETMLASLEEAGMTPIVTHPERNELLRRRLPRLRSWIENGCLMQITAGSLSGYFGKRARKSAFEMLDRNMVHVVASDAHDHTRRPPVLSGAFRILSQRYGSALAERLLIHNPKATLTGAPVERGEMREPPPRRWYHFFSR